MKLVGTVAWYEFRRVFKLKDVITTLVVMVLFALGLGLFKKWNKPSPPDSIAVIGSAFMLENGDHLQFRFTIDPELTEATARERVGSGELDAALLLEGAPDARLIVRDEAPDWLPELKALLTAAHREEALQKSSIPASELERLLAEAPLELVFESPQEAERKGRNKVAAVFCILLMVFGLFIGTANLFTGITGEKQNHVTESILSAIPVQRWIDGKLLGIGAVSLATLLSMAGSSVVANWIYGFFGEPIRIPLEALDVVATSGLLVPITVAGFAMWFAFFAAIAATIDDPNTSARGMFMFVPAGLTALAFRGLDSPDSPLFRFASMFPLTSPGAMPVRLISGNPQPWELALCLVLLAAATWAFRRLAGKIFGTAMLMRGKDLAWIDMWRSFRAS